MRLAIAFVGGVAVAAFAFILIKTPADGPDLFLPEPVGQVSASSPEPSLAPSTEVAPVVAPPPAAVQRIAAPPAPPPSARREVARTRFEPTPAPVPVEAPPTAPETPSLPDFMTKPSVQQASAAAVVPLPPPVVEPEPSPILKPGRSEIQRATEIRRAETATIPAGTVLQVRLSQTLSSENSENGDSFNATLDEPLVVNGFVIAEKGSRIDGRVVDAVRSGRIKGKGRISVRLSALHTSDRQRVDIFTDEFVREAKASRAGDATKVIGGAAIGAALGAVFGGGTGAAIGAATGAGAGAGSVLITRGGPAELSVETRIPFRLRDEVTLTERLN